MFINAVQEHLDRLKLIDVGAMIHSDDTLQDHLFALAKHPQADLICFEPQDSERVRLQETFEPYGFEILPDVIGDGEERVFHQSEAGLVSGLFKINAEFLEAFTYPEIAGRFAKETAVQTTRLDDLPELRGADFLKLDMEGAELLALRHAETLLKDVTVVQIECNIIPNQDGGCMYWEVGKFFHERGFLVNKLIPFRILNFKPWTTPPGLSQCHSSDFVFVRDFRSRGEWPARKLLNAAIILQDIYDAFDIASLLLKSFDDATGTKLWRIHADQKWR